MTQIDTDKLLGTDEKRFWEKVDKTPGYGPKGDCWEWTGASIQKDGRGIFWLDGKNQIASRVALGFHLGRPVPDGLFACHSCDNPACCNPDHLWEGNNTQNIHDARAKGRLAGMKQTHCRKGGHPLSGENLYLLPPGNRRVCRECSRQSRSKHRAKVAAARPPRVNKIDLNKVVELRKLGLSYSKIAARLNVNQASVGKALKRAEIARQALAAPGDGG